MFWEVSGGVLWLYIAAALARLLYKWIIRPPTSWSDFRGEWAVVTGASQHIGRSCALALAQRGINLILVARSADKLQSVAEEIRKRFPSVQAEVLPADLTGSQAEFDRMRAALRPSERCISILLAIAIFFRHVEETHKQRYWQQVPHFPGSASGCGDELC